MFSHCHGGEEIDLFILAIDQGLASLKVSTLGLVGYMFSVANTDFTIMTGK
jgi:hypothetical protein